MKQPLFIRAALIFCALSALTAEAGIFEDNFEDASKAAEDSGKGNNKNKNAESAAGQLDTAGTVKTVADYVGLTATTATIGTEIYEWTAVDNKKLEELDRQYWQAVNTRDSVAAEDLLRQINDLKAKKKAQAKSQADTQKTLGTIQTVAGYANLGAGAASFASAYMGYSAASDLKAGSCVNSSDPQVKAKDGDERKKCLEGDKATRVAVQKSRAAASTALWYGAGELVVGAGSLYLAKTHKDNANKLGELVDDPYAGWNPENENALFDKLAATKCGAGKPYRVNLDATPATSNSDPSVRTATGGATTVQTAQQRYPDQYAKVQCVASSTTPTPGGDPGDDDVPYVPGTTDIRCTTDAMRCADGSFVTRDPALRCQFTACPSATAPRTLVSTTSSSTSGASRAPAAAEESLSGASRAPVGDFGPVDSLP